MNCVESDHVLRRSLYLFLLYTSISVLSVSAGKAKLLRTLKNSSHPWFGEAYTRNCPDSESNWPTCYNLRAKVQESILKRAGIPENTSLKTELEVVFSAPEESIDVCGRDEKMSKVTSFTLNEDGMVTKSSLDLGAEIYRNQPKVNWDAKEGLMYTLIFWDVGFFKIRGWFYNIELKGSELLGLTNSPYYPPSNPTPNINPILIMLLEQTGSTTSKTNETMSLCVETIPNPLRAERCRNSVITWLKDGLNLVGLQVYYTNGASLYEKFRACTESFICDKSCTDKFNGYFLSYAITNRQFDFITENQRKMDFYVNFRYTGVTDKKIHNLHCCRDYVRRKFEYRPRPGNDDTEIYVGLVLPYLFDSRITLEISGPAYALKENDTYYSAVMYNLEAPLCEPEQFMVFQFSNVEYPGPHLEMQDWYSFENQNTWPGWNDTYLIVLYSHKMKILLPELCGTASYLSEERAKVRSVSFFLASSTTVCKKFVCPSVPGNENPLSLMGEYKASSEFLPEISTNENLPNKVTLVTPRISRNSTNENLPNKVTVVTPRISRNTPPPQVNTKITTEKSESCVHYVPISQLTTIVLVSIFVLL